jgi:hypothetical protein
MMWCFLRASAYVMGDDGWEWTGLKELTRLLARDENQGPRVKISFMFSLIFSPPIFFISFLWGPVLTRYWRLWMFGCMKRIKAITIRRLFLLITVRIIRHWRVWPLYSRKLLHMKESFVRESHPSVDSIPIRLSSTGAIHRTISPVPVSWLSNHPRNEIDLLEKSVAYIVSEWKFIANLHPAFGFWNTGSLWHDSHEVNRLSVALWTSCVLETVELIIFEKYQ